MSASIRPSMIRLQSWLRNLDYWAMADESRDALNEATDYSYDKGEQFPAYYNDEHDQLLRGMIAEILEYRALRSRDELG